jgi:hypothetical protein
MHNAIPLILAALMALGIIVIGCFYLLSPQRISGTFGLKPLFLETFRHGDSVQFRYCNVEQYKIRVVEFDSVERSFVRDVKFSTRRPQPTPCDCHPR